MKADWYAFRKVLAHHDKVASKRYQTLRGVDDEALRSGRMPGEGNQAQTWCHLEIAVNRGQVIEIALGREPRSR